MIPNPYPNKQLAVGLSLTIQVRDARGSQIYVWPLLPLTGLVVLLWQTVIILDQTAHHVTTIGLVAAIIAGALAYGLGLPEMARRWAAAQKALSILGASLAFGLGVRSRERAS